MSQLVRRRLEELCCGTDVRTQGDSMCAVGVEAQGENLKKRSPHEARTMSGVR